jgi:hypothetical protein
MSLRSRHSSRSEPLKLSPCPFAARVERTPRQHLRAKAGAARAHTVLNAKQHPRRQIGRAHQFFQDLVLDRDVGNQSFEPRIFLLGPLEPPRLVTYIPPNFRFHP